MRDFQVPSFPCPQCGYELSGAMAVDGRFAPRSGDLTVCVKCGALLVYGEGLRPRRMTDNDLRLVPPQEKYTLLTVQEAVLARLRARRS